MFNKKKKTVLIHPLKHIKHPVQRGAGMDEGEDKPPFKHKKKIILISHFSSC